MVVLVIAACRCRAGAGDAAAVVIVLGGGVRCRSCPDGGDGGRSICAGAGVERLPPLFWCWLWLSHHQG